MDFEGFCMMAVMSLAIACSIAGSNALVVGSIFEAMVAVIGLRSVGQNFSHRDKSSVSLGSMLVSLRFMTVRLASSGFMEGVV